MRPKCNDVTVSLIGMDGNCFAVLGAVVKALKKAGCTKTDIDAYQKEAMAGDYDNLLRVTQEWVHVE
jgi:hypothetical protein